MQTQRTRYVCELVFPDRVGPETTAVAERTKVAKPARATPVQSAVSPALTRRYTKNPPPLPTGQSSVRQRTTSVAGSPANVRARASRPELPATSARLIRRSCREFQPVLPSE